MLMRVFSTMYSSLSRDSYYQLCAIRYFMTDGSEDDDSDYRNYTVFR